MSVSASDSRKHSVKPAARDRHEVVTPYVFQVHPRLIGLPLAQPWRRASAIALDGVAIGFLSQVPKSLLVLVTAIVMFRWTAKTRKPRAMRFRRSLQVLAVLLFLGGLIGFFADVSLNGGETPATPAELLRRELLQSAAIVRLAIDVEKGTCREVDCAREPLMKFAELASHQEDLSDAEAWEAAAAIIEELNLSDAETIQLQQEFQRKLEASRGGDTTPTTAPLPGKEEVRLSRTRQAAHSVIEWGKGLLDDLGIGLGWAALYFTVFSAWWNGQTPGKKLLGIRVVQLDGTPITLWEAFERCGGYGAGFATGLLGFIQVWWDPNRQAIHDKIAETVVIRGDLPEGIQRDLPLE